MFVLKSWDQIFALMLLPIIVVVLAILYLIVVPLQGRPFLFASERMRGGDEAFLLWKLRTMEPSAVQKVLGGMEAERVTPLGHFLRRLRLDELPQIFNILKGDIRFIGPRPPLRQYVDAFPDLYGEVFRDTVPGVTGLATVMLHQREERLLSRCRTDEEARDVYYRRCLPLKARIDIIYRDNKSIWLNLTILWWTFSRLRLPCFPRFTSLRWCANWLREPSKL